MIESETRTIREGLSFGEAPRWRGGRLWFSDFYRRGVFSVDLDGDDERLEVYLDSQPSGLGWLPDGDLIVASALDRRLVRVRNGAVSEFCDLSAYFGFWANDLVTSLSGVTYAGNFGFDLDTTLRDQGVSALSDDLVLTNVVVVGPDGDVRQVVGELAFPNGTVITPDGRTLVVAETLGRRLSAFDVADNGTLSGRRLFAQLDRVAPDGICLDADGQVWVANALARECLRVREGGEITGRVVTSQRAFACALGGPDRRSLYVMTAPTSTRFTIADQRAGRIEVARVAVAGVGLP